MGKKPSSTFHPLTNDRRREVAVDHKFVAPSAEGEEKKPLVFIFDRAAIQNMVAGRFRPVAAFDIVTYTAEGVTDPQSDFCLMLAFNTVKPGGKFIVTPALARARKFAGMQAEPAGDLVQIIKPK